MYRYSACQKIWCQGNIDAGACGAARTKCRSGFSNSRQQIDIGVADVGVGQTAGAVDQYLIGWDAQPSPRRALPVELRRAGPADRRVSYNRPVPVVRDLIGQPRPGELRSSKH